MNRRLLITFALLALLALPALGNASGRRAVYYSTCYPSYSYSYATPYYAPTYYAPSYTPAYTAPAKPAIPAYSKDWRTALIDYNSALKEIEAYNQALATVVPGYSAHASYYGGQGATLYGAAPAYSVKTTSYTENVGLNLEAADQRRGRLLKELRDAGTEEGRQYQEVFAQANQNNANEREIVAKGNAVALAVEKLTAAFQAANAAPSSKTVTTYSGTGSAPVQVAQPNVAQDPQRVEFMKMARQDCARCHSPGPTMKGNFNIENVLSLNRAQADQVWARLTSDDATKVMPRPEPGKPVQHLPADHLMAWAAMLSQAQ